MLLRRKLIRHGAAAMLAVLSIAPLGGAAQSFTVPAPSVDDRGRPVGKILFSNAPIVRNKENPAQIKASFDGAEQVFAMAYLPDSLRQLGFDRGFSLFLVEERPSGFNHVYQGSALQFKPAGAMDGDQRFYDIDIFAGKKDAWRVAMTRDFLQRTANHLNEQQTRALRAYDFRLDLLVDGVVLASGKFSIDLSRGAPAIQAMHAEHQQAILAETKLPASKRNDPALSEQIRKVLVAQRLNPIKVIFSAADWWIDRNRTTGIILNRTISAYVVYKEADASCTYNEVFFKQEYVNNRFSDQLQWKGNGAVAGKIPCTNV